MLLHHGVAVYEIRNNLGYGMRWTLDIEEKTNTTREEGREERDQVKNDLDKDWHTTKTTFRGFLEPIAGMDDELSHGP